MVTTVTTVPTVTTVTIISMVTTVLNYGNYCNLPKYHTVADDHAAHGKNSVHKEYEHHIHLKGRVASSQLNLSMRRRVGTAIIFFSDAKKVKLSHEFDKYRLCLFGEKQTL